MQVIVSFVLNIGYVTKKRKKMKVKIKNYIYEIIEVDENDNDFFENGNLKLYGQTIYEKQLIKIYKNLPLTRKRDTLIHELTHAFFDVYMSSYHKVNCKKWNNNVKRSVKWQTRKI